jgi:putative membrane protein
MPLADRGPPVFFATERSVLAWLRTGLTIIAIGVVMARFSLFVLVMGAPARRGPATGRHSRLGAVRHRRRARRLARHHRCGRPASPIRRYTGRLRSAGALLGIYAVAVSLSLAGLSLLLAGYLAFETP